MVLGRPGADRGRRPFNGGASSTEADGSDGTPAEVAQPVQNSSTLSAAIAETTAPPSSLQPAVTVLDSSSVLPVATLVAPDPTPESELPPSSLVAAIPPPEPTTSSLINAVAATTTVSSAVAFVPSPTPDIDGGLAEETTAPPTSSEPTAAAVTPTPTPDAQAEENNTPATPSESPTANPAPLVPTADTAKSSPSMAGVGVGVSLGVLSVAGIAGFFLWRRRHNQRRSSTTPSDDSNSSETSILGKIFGLKKYKDNRSDPEWSIESAEKVSIAKNMRAQSVSTTTVSRSDSRGSNFSKPGSRGGVG
ncbi:hypothetical protein N0V83_007833 [Neocucurbitaria cava]|uniref:Uncharacterized protein n=1 Tax=Neocucurbitaria cava TaxID=798079 RepID=A0A9W8Y2F2_9PLEO|nr:hypothetical protein N0V83_007833 [Neocucurbitaria cava]